MDISVFQLIRSILLKKLSFLFMIATAISINVQASVIIKHTIKSGETLSTIAHKNHTTTKEIREVNGIKKGEALKPGKVLRVTMNTTTASRKKSRILHKSIPKQIKIVKKTHTLKDVKSKLLAKRNKTKIAKLNTEKKTHTLRDVKAKKVTKTKHIVKQTKKTKIKIAKVVLKKKVLAVSKKKRIVVKKDKIKKLHKKKRESKKLAKALGKHARPLTKKKSKQRQRVTIDDIFFKSSQFHAMTFNHSTAKVKNIINEAKKKLGRRYVWGAVGQRGTFDCSGFTSYVYKKNGINIPRTSINQSKFGKYISRKNLKKGDLIFFDTSKRRKGYVNHVGIYLGNGKFIHASSAKKKVVVSNLSRFYAQRYVGARRPS